MRVCPAGQIELNEDGITGAGEPDREPKTEFRYIGCVNAQLSAVDTVRKQLNGGKRPANSSVAEHAAAQAKHDAVKQVYDWEQDHIRGKITAAMYTQSSSQPKTTKMQPLKTPESGAGFEAGTPTAGGHYGRKTKSSTDTGKEKSGPRANKLHAYEIACPPLDNVRQLRHHLWIIWHACCYLLHPTVPHEPNVTTCAAACPCLSGADCAMSPPPPPPPPPPSSPGAPDQRARSPVAISLPLSLSPSALSLPLSLFRSLSPLQSDVVPDSCCLVIRSR